MAYRRGDSWVGFYRDAAGKQHTKGTFTRKRDADAWEREQQEAIRNDAWVDPDRSRLTVGEWAGTWMAGRVHLKPKTLASYRSLLDTQVLPTWGKVPLTKVRRSDVVAWVAEMRAKGLSASRTRQAYHRLTSMLDDAVKDSRLVRNPAAGVALPRLPKSERRYLTHVQLADLADGCGPHRLLVLVLGYTGLRWGEAAAIRVRRVDPLRGRIEIVEAVVDVNGRMIFGSPKTHQHRTVVVPRFLRDELAQALAGKGPDDLVFASRVGTPLRVQSVRRGWFDRSAAAAGVPGLTPHELRHTAASLAIASGGNYKVIQSMLGHGSAAMTLDLYGHLFGDDLDSVAERLDAARADILLTRRPSDADVRRIRPSS
jgi:integrase